MFFNLGVEPWGHLKCLAIDKKKNTDRNIFQLFIILLKRNYLKKKKVFLQKSLGSAKK